MLNPDIDAITAHVNSFSTLTTLAGFASILSFVSLLLLVFGLSRAAGQLDPSFADPRAARIPSIQGSQPSGVQTPPASPASSRSTQGISPITIRALKNIGWFLVPFANLVKPLGIISTLRVPGAGQELLDNHRLRRFDSSGFVLIWWACFLGSNTLAWFYILTRISALNAVDLVNSSRFQIAGSFFWILYLLLGVLVFLVIQTRLEAISRQVQTQEKSSPGP